MNPLLSIIIEVQALVKRNNSINRPSESQTHTHLCWSLIISLSFSSLTLWSCVFLLFPQIHNFCMENINELNWTNLICTALRCCALIDQRHDWDLTDFSLYHLFINNRSSFSQNTEKKSNKEAIKTQKCVTSGAVTIHQTHDSVRITIFFVGGGRKKKKDF